MESFHFLAVDPKRHAFVELMEKCQSLLLDPFSMENRGNLTHPVYDLFGETPFLAQALSVRGHAIGIFVADRHDSKRPIDRDTWDNFRLLGRQADIALALAAAARST